MEQLKVDLAEAMDDYSEGTGEYYGPLTALPMSRPSVSVAYSELSRPSVSFNSRGSYCRSGKNSGRKSWRRNITLPVLTGKSPKMFPSLTLDRLDRMPLVLLNRRLPEKKTCVEKFSIPLDSRTDDIYANAFIIKIRERRQKTLKHLKKIVQDNVPHQKIEKLRMSPNYSSTYRTPGRSTLATLSSDAMIGNYFLPSGLRPEYHISSPEFIGIHPWSQTARASFLPSQLSTKDFVGRKYRDRSAAKMLYTPGFDDNGHQERLGAFYTRQRKQKPSFPMSFAPDSSVTRTSSTPVLSTVTRRTTVFTEDDTDSNQFSIEAGPILKSDESLPFEIRTLKSGKTGLFSGNSQILPVEDSGTVSSWKWGLQ